MRKAFLFSIALLLFYSSDLSAQQNDFRRDTVGNWTHVFGRNIDSLGREVFQIVKLMDELSPVGFQSYFMGLPEYREMALDTAITETIRSGMANVTTEQFNKRYRSSFRTLTTSVLDAGINPDKLEYELFNYKEMSEDGMQGLECVLEMKHNNRKVFVQVLLLSHKEYYHLVEISPLIEE